MAKVVKHNWHLFDASGQVVGRFSTHISNILRGKYKPTFIGNADCGDHVVIINADKVVFTGRKWEQKVYKKHSGFVGHLNETKASHLRETHPERVLLHAIRGMLPKTVHRLPQLQRLHVYAGTEHPFRNIFPNQPPIAKQGDSKVPTRHFQIPEEVREEIWKKAQPLQADKKGIIDFWDNIRRTDPEAYTSVVANAEVRLTVDQYRHYMKQELARQREASKDKIITHKYNLKKKYNFDYL